MVREVFCCTLLCLSVAHVFSQEPRPAITMSDIDLKEDHNDSIVSIADECKLDARPLLSQCCSLCRREIDRGCMSNFLKYLANENDHSCKCGFIYCKQCVEKKLSEIASQQDYQLDEEVYYECANKECKHHIVRTEIKSTVIKRFADWFVTHATEMHLLFWCGVVCVVLEGKFKAPQFVINGTILMELLLGFALIVFPIIRCTRDGCQTTLSDREVGCKFLEHVAIYLLGFGGALTTAILK
jgi:hypothetical protein